MRLVDGKIRWASRVNPSLIVRLYKSDAEGFQDEELADELGYAIIARIEDIFAATESYYGHDGKIKCPACGEIMSVTEKEKYEKLVSNKKRFLTNLHKSSDTNEK